MALRKWSRKTGLWLRLSPVDLLVVALGVILTRARLPKALAGDILAAVLIAQQVLMIALVLAHRRALWLVSPVHPVVLAAWAGTLLPLCFSAAAVASPLIYRSGGVVQLLGTALTVVAMAHLGRSFGLEPAHRGIKTGGLYRAVRHPMYGAYLVSNLGFIAAHPMPLNWALLGLWLAVQVVRVVAEEKILSEDPAYAEYRARVRYRLIPYVW